MCTHVCSISPTCSCRAFHSGVSAIDIGRPDPGVGAGVATEEACDHLRCYPFALLMAVAVAAWLRADPVLVAEMRFQIFRDMLDTYLCD